MTPEKLLEWADIVKWTVEIRTLDEVIEELRKVPFQSPPMPLVSPSVRDCGCPIYGTCNNSACPRAYKITC
jgi:hypothetical protein